MTVKFNRLNARTSLAFGGSEAATLPNSDWAIGFTLVFDGAMETDGAVQTILRTTEASATGGILIGWDPTNSSRTAQAGRVYVTLDGSSTPRATTTEAAQAGRAYLFVVQKTGPGVVTKMCPILPFEPSDGASVLTSASYNLGKALVSVGPVMLGDRELNNRRLDHSMGRVFRVERSLTDAEIALLAYGKEINSILAPTWYLPLHDGATLTDQGAQESPVTVAGTFVTGSEPGYGFSSAPTAPSFTSAPTIIGAPQLGVASSYQLGTVLGNPQPNSSQKWQISSNTGTTWADIAGGTGATYVPVSADVGKLLRVRQIATNTQGSTTSDSSGALVNAEEAGATLTEPRAERIYQRVGSSAVVELAGTFTGTAPASIEYQLYALDGSTIVKPWMDAGATFGASSWTAAPSMPAPSNGKKYRIAVRAKNSSGAVLATTAVSANRFGVGDIIFVIGSSSASAWFNNGSGANLIPDHESTSLLSDGHLPGYNWGLFDSNGRGSQMAAYIAQSTGVPVAMVPLSLGGSKLSEWADTSSLGGRIISAVANVGGKIGGMLSTAGSNDITSANAAPTVQSHLDGMLAVAAIARGAGNQPNLPILWSGINRRTNAFDGPANNARSAEVAFGGTEYPNNYHVQTLDFELGGDGTHLTGAGYIACTERIQFVWAEGRKGVKMRGPEINRIAVNGTNVVVSVTHWGSNDISPASNGTGFTAYDANNALLTITNSRRLSANQIGFTCSGVPATVRYLEGQGPEVGTPYYSDAARPLPMLTAIYQPVVTGSDPVPVAVSAEFPRSWAILGSGGPVVSQVTADFQRSWAILGNTEPPSEGQDDVDGSKVAAARKVVFPGGVRVVPFGTRPSAVTPGAPSYQGGKWWSEKHPLDERYWVADIAVDLAEAGSPAVSVEAIVAGVTVLEQPVIQGALIPIKLGGLDLTAGAANYCTFRVTCANGEQFDRTIWFRPQEGKWELLKDPEDKRFYVADVTNDLVDSNTTATAATAIPVGVTELVAAQVQGGLIVVKLGGMDTSPDPTNYCTLRIDCANGERFYRTIHFTRVDN